MFGLLRVGQASAYLSQIEILGLMVPSVNLQFKEPGVSQVDMHWISN